MVGSILPVVCRTILVSHKATRGVSFSVKTSRVMQSGDIGQVLRCVSWSSAESYLVILDPAWLPVKLNTSSKVAGLDMGPREGTAVWGC